MRLLLAVTFACAVLTPNAHSAPDGPVVRTPLHEAAANGKADEVKRLLAAGAKVEALSPGLHTPLHEAAEGGHLEVVELLLEAGALRPE